MVIIPCRNNVSIVEKSAVCFGADWDRGGALFLATYHFSFCTSLVCYDCYLSLTLAPFKILVLPDWYLIMMIMMSTMKSQLLALLTFLVVLL